MHLKKFAKVDIKLKLKHTIKKTCKLVEKLAKIRVKNSGISSLCYHLDVHGC